MGLMWFTLGLLVGLSALGALELRKHFQVDWRGWIGLAVGIVLVLFCIAWSVASLAEAEPRAASMGLLLFGGTGVAVLALTGRLLIAPTARSAKD